MEDAHTTDPVPGPGADAVRAQLVRILESAEFHATDRLRALLRFVVEEKLQGRAQRLKGYSIAVAVFGRDVDFDPTHDPVVRVQARKLRAALERYYLTAGTRDRVVIDIPKGGYVPEFTTRIAAAEPTRLPPVPRAKHPTEDRSPRLAVAPFDDLTRDSEQQIFATGLTEELITELTRFQDVAVFACQPPRRSAGGPLDPEELARSVDARFLLRGAVRRDPQTVKVSARLSDTDDGRQIWADAFTCPAAASELISTQERIARTVVGAVAGEFGIIARHLSAESRRKRPAELATYEAMLCYYSHQIDPRPESAATCFAALRAAAEREPDYGAVWSALATLFCQMHTFDVPGHDRPLETALEFASRGVALDPGSQLARMVQAYASHLAEDSDGFRKEARRTLELNPRSAYAVGAIGYFHAMRGEFAEGLPLIDRAIAANPCHPAWLHAAHVLDHLQRGDAEAALVETRKHRPFVDYWDDVVLAAILGRIGRDDEAAPHVRRVRQVKSDFPDRARELIERSLKHAPLVESLLDGLRGAGMRIGAGAA
jgi:adenylate cyclase